MGWIEVDAIKAKPTNPQPRLEIRVAGREGLCNGWISRVQKQKGRNWVWQAA
jgi:hypothetical protein